MGSQNPDSASSHHRHTCSTFKMEAIKKKMQAMKVEKDNACDQADVSEEKMKAARIRAQKGEDEVAELELKSRQLETEGCGQQSEVPGGCRGEGQPEGEDLQGADQD